MIVMAPYCLLVSLPSRVPVPVLPHCPLSFPESTSSSHCIPNHRPFALTPKHIAPPSVEYLATSGTLGHIDITLRVLSHEVKHQRRGIILECLDLGQVLQYARDIQKSIGVITHVLYWVVSGG